jgi:putative Mn2+ efflux pump MntP
MSRSASALSVETFLLSLASSTDNFMVGLSVGLGRKHLGVAANLLISLCNAMGAGVAGYLGGSLPHYLPLYLAPLLAALAFGLLAAQGFAEFHHKHHQSLQSNDKSQRQQRHLDTSRALQLALPMTLNNLAGGVAAGAVGVTVVQASLYGLLASFLTMLLGYLIGQYAASKVTASTDTRSSSRCWVERVRRLLDPSFVSATLLGILFILSCQEAWKAIYK